MTSQLFTTRPGPVKWAEQQTTAASAQVPATAGELAKQSETLRAEVDAFLAQVRAA